MGALTSKNQAFKVRPWELQKFFFIDFFDILGSSIYVDIIGNRIVRILNNSKIFWLTDKIRFFYDSIDLYRLGYPFINFFFDKYNTTLLFIVTWMEIFDYFFSIKSLLKFTIKKKFICNLFNTQMITFLYFFKYKEFINFFINDDFDLLNSLYLKKLTHFINFNFINNFNFIQLQSMDFLVNFFFSDLSKYKNIYLIYCNLRTEIPTLYYFFLKKIKAFEVNLFSIGYNIKLNCFLINLDLDLKKFLFSKNQFLLNKNFFKSNFFNNSLILHGLVFSQRYDYLSLSQLTFKFFNFFKNVDIICINQNLSFYSLLVYDLNIFSLNLKKRKKNLLNWFFNDLSSEKITNTKNFINICLSHHVMSNYTFFDIFLPTEFSFEKKMIFLNSFNQLNEVEFLITPKLKNVRSFSSILFLFSLAFHNANFINLLFLNIFNLNFLYFFFILFRKYFFILYSFNFLKLNLLKLGNYFYNQIFINVKKCRLIVFSLYNVKIHNVLTNYYLMNQELNNFIFNIFKVDLSSKYSFILNLKIENNIKKIYKV